MDQLVKLLSLLVGNLAGSDKSKRDATMATLAQIAGMKVEYFTDILDGKVESISDADLEGLGKAFASGGEDTDSLKAKIATLQAKLDDADGDSQQVAMLQQRLQKMEDERAAEFAERRVAACKIPALRHHLRALFELAGKVGDDQKVKLFSVDSNGKKDFQEVEPVTVVEQFSQLLNDKFSKYFTETGGHEDRTVSGGSDQDVSEEVDRAVSAYMEKHDKLSYSEALNRVLDADPDLKQRYAGGLN